MSLLADWSPPELSSRAGDVFRARHAWCVGRNYAEHAREMGADPKASAPIGRVFKYSGSSCGRTYGAS